MNVECQKKALKFPFGPPGELKAGETSTPNFSPNDIRFLIMQLFLFLQFPALQF